MDKTNDIVTSPVVALPRAMPYTYEVASVERTDAPDGSMAKDWYRYVLKSGRSTITGQRRGSRSDVQGYAVQCAAQLNARALEGKSVWSPRGKKPAPASP